MRVQRHRPQPVSLLLWHWRPGSPADETLPGSTLLKGLSASVGPPSARVGTSLLPWTRSCSNVFRSSRTSAGRHGRAPDRACTPPLEQADATLDPSDSRLRPAIAVFKRHFLWSRME